MVTLPLVIGGIGSWLDASWQVGLSLAHRAGIPLGSRLIFSYGPYGYLNVPTPFFPGEWYAAVATTVVVHVLLIAAVTAMLLRRRASPFIWLVTAVALAVGLPVFGGLDTEGSLLVVALGFLALDITSMPWSALAAGTCGATLALMSLIKVTALPLVGGVLLIVVAAALLRRRSMVAGVLLGTFVVVGAALWFAAGLGFGDVPGYLHASLDLGTGYSDAMYLGGLKASLVGLVMLAVIGVAGLCLLIRGPRLEGVWLLLVDTALFPLLKDSLVREGPIRRAGFFGIVAILAALSLAVIAPSMRGWLSRGKVAFVLLLSTLVVAGVAWRATDSVAFSDTGARIGDYPQVIRSLTDVAARDAIFAPSRISARNQYQDIIAGLASVPTGATLDVMPWDTGLMYADPALTWDPRPVLQSHSAYTSGLDTRDAAFLRGGEAPRYIVYRYQTIDDRYAAFDEPATFRVLLDDYRVVKVLTPTALLLARVSQAPPSESSLSTACAPTGSAVPVPQRAGALVYVHVSISPTVAGRAIDLLAKSSSVQIRLTTGAMSTDRRLIPSTAANGLFVSFLLNNTSDVQALMSGTGGTPITSISIRASSWAWSTQYCVAFTSTPAPPRP